MAIKSMVGQVEKDMSRVVFYQFLIILGFTLLMFLLKGMQSGLSTLVGAVAYGLPTLVFIWRVAHARVQGGMRFLVVFMLGESIKLLLCGILFIVFIKYLHVHVLDALIGLMGAIVAFWLASAVFISKTEALS
jgi:F0F1-type ATP synthase assembly protein I